MSDTPRKMNAAQLASRKIKAPTRRTKPSSNQGDDGNQAALFAPMPTSSFGAQSAGGGGMFGGGVPSANNSFNFAAPLQANFGGSVSFPPSTASTLGNATDHEEAARRNKPFQMGGFGSGAASPAPQAGGGLFGQSAPASNPFSSTPQPQAPGGGFSFGASSNQNQPASNPFSFGQSAQAPPATGGFTFGQSTAQTAPVNNPFQTSQAPSSTPGLSFGSTAPTTQATGGFSFTASQPAAQAANPFSFGNGTPAEKPSTPSFTFGQTQPQGGSQAGSLPGSQTPSRAESPASFDFGATPAASKPAGGAFTFGQSQAATPAQTQAPNLFGRATPAAAPPSNLFGQPTPAAAAPASNIFGKPAGQETAAPAPINPFAPTGGNPFANIKIPDAATSPAPSSNFFGSQTSRSVSPEKDMSGTESAAEPTPSLFGASTKQPTIANDLFKVQQPAPSPAKSIFSNFGAATTTPAKQMFGGEKSETPSLFGSQTPKAAPPATDLFGKPKVPEAPKAAGSPFGKPADAITIFSQPDQRNGFINTIDNANEKPLANGNTALSEINNGAKSPSRNASTLTSKLGDINSSTRLNPPTTTFQQQTKSPSRNNQTFQFTPTTTSTDLVKVPDTSDMAISEFQKVVLERAEEYDENELFTKAHKAEIARIVAKYFPSTLSPRQQLEAYAAIQIKALKRRAEIDMENATQPAKKMRIKEQLADWEQGVKQWSVVQAKRVEKRKADSLLDDGGMNGEGSNKRQKPAEPKVQKAAAAAPLFGSPAKSNADKAPLPSANKPKVPSSLKNVFTPKPAEATPPKPAVAAPKPAEAAPTPTPKAKRKADVQLTKDDPTGDESTPGKNGKAGSATSSLFRNIVGSTPTSTPEKPMFSLTKTTDDKPRPNPFAALKLPPNAASTPNGASPLKAQPASATPTPAAQPKAAGGFVFKPTQPAAGGFKPTPPAAGGFKPTQPAAGGPTDFMSQFAQSAKKTADAAMEKAKDEDWDEDDETEAEWEKRYHKELAEKREAAKQKPALAVPTFGAPASPAPAQSPAAKGPAGGNDGLTSTSRSGTSSPNSVLNEYVPGSGQIGSKLGNPFAHLSDASSGKGNDADDDSDGAPAPTPKAAGSLFSRVSRGAPTTASGGSSVFGSVASSPAATEPADKTWNPDSPIRFGASAGAKTTTNLFGSVSGAATPSLFGSPAAGAASPAPMFGKHAVTGSPAAAASPAPLFGKYAVTPAAPAFGSTASTEAKDKPTMGFSFGSGPAPSTAPSGAATPTAPKSAPFSFLSNGGGLGPTPSLGASRATTPGVTTENESTADEAAASHDDNEPGAELPQNDLASGEEAGEKTLVLTKVKARMMTPEKKWGPSTVGTLKLLRNEKTASVRYLIRLPNGSVGMNKAFINSKPRLIGKNVAVIMMADAGEGEKATMTTVSLATNSEGEAKKLAEAIEGVIGEMEAKA
ncbi:hypothetical protein VE03_05741 [Pseudogymnoascus sp. 23342-1-I1]|nr:hypothetical protein VE03_05741 [Pseudogymnoascus sp. 23342-1-I1]